MQETEIFDCVIVGAGPAGLTTLEYLARFHRRVAVLGAQGPKPRLLWIDRTYNLPGYPQGVAGAAILARLREQAEEYGGLIRPETATRIGGKDGAFEVSLSNGETLRARKIVLAMGIRDREPDIPDLARHNGHFMRYCPVCDGYEHTDKKLGIIGSGESVARHALFLRIFSPHITILLHGEKASSLVKYAEKLRRSGIEVREPRVAKILEAHLKPTNETEETAPMACGVQLQNGEEIVLDVLYGALGCNVNLDAALDLNLALDEDGYVATDIHQQTSVAGIYAAGDLVSQINQISVAFGQAAISAVRIHNELDDSD